VYAAGDALQADTQQLVYEKLALCFSNRLNNHVERHTCFCTQLWNAAKYFSGFPQLLLSAFEHEAHAANRPFPLRGCWLLVCAFNGLYSFYWDVEQDWKMPWLATLWGEARQRRLQQAQGACVYFVCYD